jgi:hypothetical protein
MCEKKVAVANIECIPGGLFSKMKYKLTIENVDYGTFYSLKDVKEFAELVTKNKKASKFQIEKNENNEFRILMKYDRGFPNFKYFYLTDKKFSSLEEAEIYIENYKKEHITEIVKEIN